MKTMCLALVNFSLFVVTSRSSHFKYIVIGNGLSNREKRTRKEEKGCRKKLSLSFTYDETGGGREVNDCTLNFCFFFAHTILKTEVT